MLEIQFDDVAAHSNDRDDENNLHTNVVFAEIRFQRLHQLKTQQNHKYATKAPLQHAVEIFGRSNIADIVAHAQKK